MAYDYEVDDRLYTPDEVDVISIGGESLVRKAEYDKAYKYAEIFKAHAMNPAS